MEVDEMEKLLIALSARIDNLKETCPLEGYKGEMRERCKRFSDNILVNEKALVSLDRHISDTKVSCKSDMVAIEIRLNERIKVVRNLVGRVISGALIIGIALVSVIGTIQVNKVGHAEYAQHIASSKINVEKSAARFESFMDTYRFDRDRRDAKIDRMFQKQLDFNSSMIRNNMLLQQQLEVVKAKLGVK